MRRACTLIAACAAALTLLAAGSSHAGDPPKPERVDNTLKSPVDRPPLPPVELPVEDPDRNLSYWARGKPRMFVAWRVDVGVLFFRPRASIGYGRPHNAWFGLDLNPIVSGEGIGTWTGLRLSLPNIDLRAGVRTHYGFRRSLLLPARKFTSESINLRVAPKSRYASIESELTWGFPVGPLVWFGEVAATYVSAARDDLYVFEETIRVVVEPPWVWRVRTGVAFDAGLNGALSVGPVAELVGVPKRDLLVLRLGLVARMKLYDDLEARLTLLPQVISRDELGIGGGDSFQMGLRWKWATGQTPDRD